jgi:hypothetical protein
MGAALPVERCQAGNPAPIKSGKPNEQHQPEEDALVAKRTKSNKACRRDRQELRGSFDNPENDRL